MGQKSITFRQNSQLIEDEIYQVFTNELTETTKSLAGQFRCGSGNVLHSTATESELPKPGTEYRYVGNILGNGAGVHISNRPDTRAIFEPKEVRERQIAGIRNLPKGDSLSKIRLYQLGREEVSDGVR